MPEAASRRTIVDGVLNGGEGSYDTLFENVSRVDEVKAGAYILRG